VTRRTSPTSPTSRDVVVPAVVLASHAAVPAPVAEAAAPPPAPTCEARITEADLAPPTARQRRYLRSLPRRVVHDRITNVLFLSFPEATESALRERIASSRAPYRRLQAARDAEAHAALREAALREGYFLAEEGPTMTRILRRLDPEDFFDASTIVRQRGDAVVTLTRDGDVYRTPEGRVARLRPNDRLAESVEALGPRRHLDLDAVRRATGAVRTVPRRVGAAAAELELRFPDGTARPALVRLEDGETRVACVGGDDLDATLADARRVQARMDALRATVDRFLAENNRFDEPLDEPEDVQEDGQLRIAWREAYARGRRTFTYRDVEYRTFDRAGNPTPPQVCIDFVLDVWQRAHGTWFAPRGERPERVSGAVDFHRHEGFPRRSLRGLLAWAADEETPIARHDVPWRNRVSLSAGPAFVRAMVREAPAHFAPGDLLVLHGIREQDMRYHLHALLLLDVEPVSGVPALVADNQSRPRLRTLESALRAAPLRSIKHRLRVDWDAPSFAPPVEAPAPAP
jgi:hypothetical protein